MVPAMSLLTRRQWLQQTLSGTFRDFGPMPSRRREVPSPMSVTYWDVSAEIENFIHQSDDTSKAWPPIHEVNPLDPLDYDYASENTALYNFRFVLRCVGRVLGYGHAIVICENAPSSSSPRYDENASQQAQTMATASYQFADLKVELSGRTVLVVEMKRPAVFRPSASSPIPTMCTSLYQASLPDSPVLTVVLVEPLHQLYRYMRGMELAYGIISSFDLTYLVRRTGETGDTLEISKGIPSTSQEFLGALAYMVDKAIKEPIQFKSAPDMKHEGGSSKASALAIPQSKGSQGKSREHEGNKPSPNMRLHGMKTRSSVVDGLRETPAELLHLAPRHFATGWSGKIVRGTYEGEGIVVKLAPTGSDRAEALLTEVAAYHKLKEFWGKYVPKLVSYGTTAGGTVVYIATEDINGHEMGMGTLSQDVVKEIFDALTVVHQCGIVHGDIRPSNILVAKGWEAGVRLIDFGFAHPISSSEDCMREHAQLERLLSEFGCGQIQAV